MTAQFVDISAFQPQNIDWQAYAAWSRQGDRIARVAMRSSYGTGFTDTHFESYRAGALAAGVDVIIYYHYGYPQYNAAIDEANYQHSVVGAIRPQDIIALDYEENVAQATADWAYQWLQQAEALYGQLPIIYSYPSFIENHLQYPPLAKYPLWYADWVFDPNTRPPAPSPWTSYDALQYSDNATGIPGINQAVDIDIFLGPTQGDTMPLQLSSPFAATYFTGDDTRWNCSNGCSIFGGILAYYRQIQGAPRLPITNEINDIPGVAYQIYEAGIIVYDPQNKLGKPAGAGDCYMVMLGSDLGKKCTGMKALEEKIASTPVQVVEKIPDNLRTYMQSLPSLEDQMHSAWQAIIAKLLEAAGLPAQ